LLLEEKSLGRVRRVLEYLGKDRRYLIPALRGNNVEEHATQWDGAHPLGGYAVCLTVQDNLSNDTNLEFEPRSGQSSAAVVGRLISFRLSGEITRPRGYPYWDSRQHNPLEDYRKSDPDPEHSGAYRLLPTN